MVSGNVADISAAKADAPATPVEPIDNGGLMQLMPDSGFNASAKAPPAKKMIYSLNPFDQGTSRELGAPMEIEDPTGNVKGDEPGDPS